MMRGNSKNGYDHFLQNYDGKKLTGKFRNIDGVPLDWDEMAFLENDPDALKQILEEKANSGYEVFANRIKHAGLWDEDSYLLSHNDVNRAVDQGTFKDGLSHYISYGKNQNRKASVNIQKLSHHINKTGFL